MPLSKRLAFLGSIEDTSAEDSAVEPGDITGTPRRENGHELGLETPMAMTRSISQRKSSTGTHKPGSNLTLRDQEKVRKPFLMLV